MRKKLCWCASILAIVVVTSAHAQCNRGGRGGSATGSFSPITSATGLNSPLASFGSLNTSPNASFLAAQQRSQYQYMLAMQMMAQRQQMLERQIQALQNSHSSSHVEQIASNEVDRRREGLRQKNAEKAFQVALRAEANGRTSTAESNYKRVVRIVGNDSDLGRRASEALARISHKPVGRNKQTPDVPEHRSTERNARLAALSKGEGDAETMSGDDEIAR